MVLLERSYATATSDNNPISGVINVSLDIQGIQIDGAYATPGGAQDKLRLFYIVGGTTLSTPLPLQGTSGDYITTTVTVPYADYPSGPSFCVAYSSDGTTIESDIIVFDPLPQGGYTSILAGRGSAEPLTWVTSGVDVSDSTTQIITSQINGVDAYDKVAYALFPGNNGNVYASITFTNDSTKYQYAGVSQTMTDTSQVAQYASKIDFGFKQDGDNVLTVFNGEEDATAVIGSVTEGATYTVVRISKMVYYYKNGDLQKQTFSPLLNGTEYRFAYASYSGGASLTFVGGSHNATPEYGTPLGNPLAGLVKVGSNLRVNIQNPASDNNSRVSYKVYVKGPTDSSFSLVSSTLQYPDSYYDFTPTESGEYSAYVTAYNSYGDGGTSDTVTINTVSSPNLNGITTSKTVTSVTITLPPETAGDDSQAQYTVKLYNSSGTLVNTYTSTGSGATATFTGLEGGTTYGYTLQVVNAVGDTGESGTNYITTDPNPLSGDVIVVDVSGVKRVYIKNLTLNGSNVENGAEISIQYIDLTGDSRLQTATYTNGEYADITDMQTAQSITYNSELLQFSNQLQVSDASVTAIPGNDHAIINVDQPNWSSNNKSLFSFFNTVYATLKKDGQIVQDNILFQGGSFALTVSGLTETTTYTYEVYATVSDGLNTYSTLLGSTTFTTTAGKGGGGGGGGGGNNGGNGYNNMAAALEYNYPDWSASVTQTNTITVLGEDSSALTVDETITVNVPLAKFKECIVYDSNWALQTGEAAGSQPLPKVAFRPSADVAAKTELDAMFAKLKAKMADKPLADRVWDDDASASHDSFGKRLIQDVTFTGSVFDTQDLPKVAIRSVAEGDIAVDELTTTVAPVTTEANSTHKAYLEGLFEQLVAANRIKGDDATSSSAPAFGAAKCPSLVGGDSISFKVKYSFTKTREYEVDGLDSGNGNSASKALTLSIAGQSFTIQTGADGSEVSNTYDRTYEIKLVAVA